MDHSKAAFRTVESDIAASNHQKQCFMSGYFFINCGKAIFYRL